MILICYLLDINKEIFMKAIKEITSIDMQLDELEAFFGTEFTGELKLRLLSLIKAYPEFIIFILNCGSGLSLDSLIELFLSKIAKQNKSDFLIFIHQTYSMDSSPLNDVMLMMLILALLDSNRVKSFQTEIDTTVNLFDNVTEIFQYYKSEINNSNRAKAKLKL